MAVNSFKGAIISYGSIGTPVGELTPVGCANTATLEITQETTQDPICMEDVVAGNGCAWQVNKASTKGYSLSIDQIISPDDADLQAFFSFLNNCEALTVRVSLGTETGDLEYTGDYVTTGITLNFSTTESTTKSLSLTGTGELVESTVS